MAHPEHIRPILKRVLDQLEKNIEKNKEMKIEKDKTSHSPIAKPI